MANRYWVGGTANWDGTAGTKWSATSGGAGGAAVPTTADDVFFSNLSTGTCTIATGNTGAKSINCTGFTGTIAGTAGINVAGSVTLVAGMTHSYTGGYTITSTGIFTSGGKEIRNLGISAPGGTVGLGDALLMTTPGPFAGLTVGSGTFNTNNFNVTCPIFNSNNSSVRAINLGSSTVTVTINDTSTAAWDLSTTTNLTFNAGTSTIIGGAFSSSHFSGGGLTYYNFAFTATSGGTKQVSGSNTFNNFSVTSPGGTGVITVQLNANQVINGTLSNTSAAGNRRVWFFSNTYGVRRTLTINSAPSLTDADFRDIIVTGTAAPISGTRIGDRGQNTGITFSAPKTVYWNLAGAQNWSANAWATTSTGTPSTDNFPLPQDTATFTNAGSVTGTITLDTAIGYTGTVDMSGRTSAMTLSAAVATAVYGNWINGSGTTISGAQTLTFSGEGTKTITSAGKTFTCSITIDSYGGTVELADAFDMSGGVLVITRGTFDTNSYSLIVNRFRANSNDISYIKLGSSTITTTTTSNQAVNFSSSLSTLDPGTSTFICTSTGGEFLGGGYTFYNVSFTDPSPSGSRVIGGANTFNNLSFTVNSDGTASVLFDANNTISGTLTCAGSSATARGFLASSVIGTSTTLTVNAISANNCDFRDITLAGAAAGASPTRAGDCGGNSGVNFPAPKNAYRVSTADNTWGGGASGWALTSGGAGSRNNFPLAQDTAVIDNSSIASGGNLNSGRWNVGSIDFSSRTIPVNFSIGTTTFSLSGNLTLSSSVTVSGVQILRFVGRGTQTITSAGVTLLPPIEISCATGTVQLADAFNSSNTLTLTSGTLDAVTYNVTTGAFSSSNSNVRTLSMGSGLWTLTGFGSTWALGTTTNLTFLKGTADILFFTTAIFSREFAGGGLSYNKLTIGGTATGATQVNFFNNNQFTELASTKTVGHIISFGSTIQTFGKWTVTGTAGNVVTLAGTGTGHILAGSATTGIDYLDMGLIGFSSASPGEFYAGANSTGTAAAPVFRTVPPAARTLYWIGGTGNWNDTAKWSLSSGGAGGEPVPRSMDNVVFDMLSNLTAYTATVNAITGGNRCNQLTIAGPASGNLTLAGTTTLFIHGNVTLPATGLTRTYTGAITLSGSTTGKTFTTNGVGLGNAFTVNGIGCEWTLGSSLSTGSSLTITNGSFDTGGFSTTVNQLFSTNSNARTLSLGSSTVTVTSGNPAIDFTNSTNFTFNAGTSSISCTLSTGPTVNGGGITFYNMSFTGTGFSTITLTGQNTFNNLTFPGKTLGAIGNIPLSANQTINGTLTFNAGTNVTFRTFAQSNTPGITRTLTCNAMTATDVDFRDVTIAGSAAPVSGTRLGDCGGNTGITFDAAKTVYWNLAGSQNWSATAWATSSGGTPAVNNFPLAQDTAVIDNAGAAGTVLLGTFNIGTLDASLRTSAFTLNHAVTSTFYGSYILGSGTTMSGGSQQNFSGRGTMTITTAGKTLSSSLLIDAPTGTFRLGSALTLAGGGITLTRGTLDAANYSVTVSGFSSDNSNTRTIAFGSGTWVSGGGWSTNPSTNLTVTGTGTISMTNLTTKTFAGGSASYSGITLNQGSTPTLTITGNNTFANITDTAVGATTIALGTTTQRVGNFSATGTAGNVLTITGVTSNLIYTGGGVISGLDYLNVQGRAYGSNGEITGIWAAGANSTNSGSLGWSFTSGAAVLTASIIEAYTSQEAQDAAFVFNASATENSTMADEILAAGVYVVDISENSNLEDSSSTSFTLFVSIDEGTTLAEFQSLASLFAVSITENSTAGDIQTALAQFNSALTENTALADAAAAAGVFSVVAVENSSLADTTLAQTIFNVLRAEGLTLDDIADTVTLIIASITEGSTLEETSSAAAIFLAATTENVVSAETESALKVLVSSINETLTVANTQAAQAVFNVLRDEGLTVNDISNIFKLVVASITEGLTPAETVSSLRVLVGSITENLVSAEAESALRILVEAIAENTILADITESQKVITALQQEGFTTADISNIFKLIVASITEGLTPAETVSSLRVLVGSITENVVSAETESALRVLVGSITENATLADLATPQKVVSALLAEGLTVADISNLFKLVVSSITEGSTLAEASATAAIFAASINEGLVSAETESALRRLVSSINETLTVANAQSSQAVFNTLLAEGLTVDDVQAVNRIVIGSITEGMTVVETEAAVIAFIASITENLVSANTQAALKLLVGSITENLVSANTQASQANFNSVAVEPSNLADVAQAQANFNSAVAEATNINDVLNAVRTLVGVISENSDAADSQNRIAVFFASDIEGLLSQDNQAAQVNFNSNQVENMVISTQQVGYGWFRVVDDQTIVWADVNNTQSITWTNIGDQQNPNWAAVNNAQSIVWTDVEDNQDPNWVEINNSQP